MPSKANIKLAPSLLSADFAMLGDAVEQVEEAGADMVHVDIMDGHFVPKITWGPDTVSAIKARTKLPLDVHLMIIEPERQIQGFLDAGSDILTVHLEACTHLHRIIEVIKNHGAKAGAALNPGTSVIAIEGALHWLDQVLVMTVNPGLPGQKFIPGMEKKIARVKHILTHREIKADLEVDGGINAETAPLAVKAGANVLVAGSAVFNSKGTVAENVRRIRANL